MSSAKWVTTSSCILLASLALGLGCENQDNKISATVKEKIAREADPSVREVDVVTRDHIVTLTGVVGSESAKGRLESDARSVRGVLAVDDRLVIEGTVSITSASTTPIMDPADRAIYLGIRSRFDEKSLGDLDLDVRDGVITLSGQVSPSDHDEAIRTAHEVDPQARVNDQLILKK